MNQIIFVKDNNENKSNTAKKKKFVFKAQFLFSITFLFILVSLFVYFRYSNQENFDKNASNLSNSYQVYRLYSNDNENSKSTNDEPSIIGNIEIPKLDISYPILSTLSENLLKVSPCRFFGDISDDSNLCIAGHNFDNNSFFSRIRTLENKDEIIISDNDGTIYKFSVFDNYEVSASDLSPIYEIANNYSKELTLVTCNNQNGKRIIIKAMLVN